MVILVRGYLLPESGLRIWPPNMCILSISPCIGNKFWRKPFSGKFNKSIFLCKRINYEDSISQNLCNERFGLEELLWHSALDEKTSGFIWEALYLSTFAMDRSLITNKQTRTSKIPLFIIYCMQLEINKKVRRKKQQWLNLKIQKTVLRRISLFVSIQKPLHL